MPKLHEIVAARTAKAKRQQKALMELLGLARKADLFSGMHKRYEPLVDGDVIYPPESVHVRSAVSEVIVEARRLLTDLADLEAANAYGNTLARADVEIEGRTPLLADVPITTLMTLEKWISDLRDLVAGLPILDGARTWEWDTDIGSYRSEAAFRLKTKKVAKAVTLSEATKEHPAQVQLVHEDVPEGRWLTTYFSTAIPQSRKAELLRRVDQLAVAIRQARERANAIDVPGDTAVAQPLLDFVFAE